MIESLMSVPIFTAGTSPDRIRRMAMERSGDIDDVNDVNEPEPDSELGDR